MELPQRELVESPRRSKSVKSVCSHEKKQDSIDESEERRNEADIRLLEDAAKLRLCARNLMMVRRGRRRGEQVGGENSSIYSIPSLGATKVLACLNRSVGVGSANGRQGLPRAVKDQYNGVWPARQLSTLVDNSWLSLSL